MIERNRHTKCFDVTCDSCSTEYLEVETEDFKAVIREIKLEGWSVFKDDDDEWNHTCPNCGIH